MNRIGEILAELAVLQGQRVNMEQLTKENTAKTAALTTEWQGLCQHPAEYNEMIDDGWKCCACGYIRVEVLE
jgi:hypothetical protein